MFFSSSVSGSAYALWPEANFAWYPFQTPGLVAVPVAFLLPDGKAARANGCAAARSGPLGLRWNRRADRAGEPRHAQRAGRRYGPRPPRGGLRVAVLIAQGPVFSVGGDLRWFADTPEPSERIAETAALLHETLHTLARLPLPVVSVVHGPVAGGGIGIALGADIVLVGSAAKLRVAYTAAALSPDCGVSWLLARRIGLARALDLALTNRVVTAAELREWGLVSRVVEQEFLTDEAEEAVSTGERLRAGARRDQTTAAGGRRTVDGLRGPSRRRGRFDRRPAPGPGRARRT